MRLNLLDTAKTTIIFSASLWCLISLPVSADTVRVAVAANFTLPMQQIAQLYEQRSGSDIEISSGSSGKLFAQIQHGAPYDLFLSADTEKPTALIRSGHAVAGSQFTYAIGRLALWGLKSSDPLGKLKSGNLKRLAVANPRLAPYGIAANQTLKQLGLLTTNQHLMVTGENISQTYQFVVSGNAELGFVAQSQLLELPENSASVWYVPESFHDPIRQDAVLLSRSTNRAESRALLAFLRSSVAEEIIHQHGYRIASPARSRQRP